MEFCELLNVGRQDALGFFLESLLRHSPRNTVCDDEIAYVASILADRALTSAYDPETRNLTELYALFERMALRQETREFRHLEEAGAQDLVFAGFFRDQLKWRHNMGYFDDIGRSIYLQASERAVSPNWKEFFSRMSRNFHVWALICRDIHRRMRDEPYLLRFN